MKPFTTFRLDTGQVTRAGGREAYDLVRVFPCVSVANTVLRFMRQTCRGTRPVPPVSFRGFRHE